MATQVNLRRILDRKQWEPCAPPPTSTIAGSFIVSSNLHDQFQYYCLSTTLVYQYDPAEDAWQTLPSPAMGGTFGAGACGARHPFGPSGTATAGSASTISTNLNLQRDLRGYQIMITGGPGAGDVRTILSNTIGASAIITVTSPFSATPTASTTYQLLTGRFYYFNAGTLSASSFKVYDLALNTWSSLSITGLPATWGTDGKLISTPGEVANFAVGTATSGTSTTLTNTAKSWAVNKWANSQVRITAGTGAGQSRTIASNTATVLTVSSAWTITPDATSQYVIEGNSDYLYLLGNNAVTMYRYSISGNSWTTLSPGIARPGAPVAGMTANWVWNSNDADWTNENTGLNGRYIYSFRSNSTALDRYDIATNSWSNVVYAPAGDTIVSGGNYAVYQDNYIYVHLGNTGRWVKYNVVESRIEPFSQLWYAQSTLHIGDRAFDVTYTDGPTKLKYIYMITNNQNMMFRCLVF